MSDAWLVVLAVGLGTFVIKASGPVLLGGRPLPDRVQAVVALLAPALLAALVATNTFALGSDPRAGRATHRRGRCRRGSRAARSDPGGRHRRGGVRPPSRA